MITIQRLVRSKFRGQGAVEYALIAVLIAIVVLGVCSLFSAVGRPDLTFVLNGPAVEDAIKETKDFGLNTLEGNFAPKRVNFYDDTDDPDKVEVEGRFIGIVTLNRIGTKLRVHFPKEAYEQAKSDNTIRLLFDEDRCKVIQDNKKDEVTGLGLVVVECEGGSIILPDGYAFYGTFTYYTDDSLLRQYAAMVPGNAVVDVLDLLDERALGEPVGRNNISMVTPRGP